MKIIILSMLLLFGFCTVQANIVLVANNDVSVSSLAKKDVKAIFLGKKKKWDDGKKAVIVIQKKGDVHKKFVRTAVGKSVSQYKTYWKKIVFTGKGKQPKTVKSDSDVLAYVARTSGAVGYISDATSAEGVKTISIK